jgi:tetratricopeptide (TPR) repeat protein
VILTALLSKTLVGQSIQEADTLYYQNQFTKANSLYQKLLEKRPNDPIILYNIGNSKFKGGNINDAISFYQKSIETSKDKALTAKANNNLGLALIKTGNPQGAIRAFKAALKLTPEDNETRENLQMALSKINKNEEKQNVKTNQEHQKVEDKSEITRQQSEIPLEKSEYILNLVQNQENELREKSRDQFRKTKSKLKKDW